MGVSNRCASRATLQKNASADVSPKNCEATLEALPSGARPHYKLDELLAKITDENRHNEIAWGAPVGKETW